jgi:hypothetical protein
MNKLALRNEVSLDPTFSFEGKVAWGMDTPKGQPVRDNNIQDNFDYARELIEDGEYVNLPAHLATGAEQVGFLLLDDSATPEAIAEQEAQIQAAKDEGKVPFHYEVAYVRYVEYTQEKNPNRKRASRGRGARKTKAAIA